MPRYLYLATAAAPFIVVFALHSASLENRSLPLQVISLNVGGTHYSTSLTTLRRDPHSMLAAMFSGKCGLARDSSGAYFLDYDGSSFGTTTASTHQHRRHPPAAAAAAAPPSSP
mmetsp:Transcript_73660/g.209885  ORF Transcript_73660/g.209885 Transcript_73660/m.209885 type:complete len:114 (+) Transcript_73660:400-741(+)